MNHSLHPHTLRLGQVGLLIVDVQEAFRPAVAELGRVAASIALLARGAGLLGVPTWVTEQAPAKLGTTIDEVRTALPAEVRPTPKTCFSACGADGTVPDQLRSTGLRQVLLTGIETHICVSQTAHDLIAAGFQVHVPIDCTASRTTQNYQVGLDRMRGAGAILTSVETALFELTRDASHPQFRAISKLVK